MYQLVCSLYFGIDISLFVMTRTGTSELLFLIVSIMFTTVTIVGASGFVFVH